MFPLTRDRSRNRSAFGYRPTLNLIFGPNSGDTLDPRITFSRTSNATQFDSSGNLVYAPHNLLTFSEQFDNAAWGKNAITIGANATAAPDGTVTADKIQETAVTNFFAISSNPSGSYSTAYTHSIYAKAGERTSMQVSFTVSVAAATFNLSNGTVTSSSGSSLISASIQSVGNGWYRCITRLTTVASGANPLFHIVGTVNDAGSTTFAGVAGNGIFIWGAQLNIGTLQPYYPTTVKNLLGYSQEFDNAAWTKSNSFVQTNLLVQSEDFATTWTTSNSSVTTNSTTAPNNSTTADTLVENTANAEHFVQQTYTVGANSAFSFSAYVKAAGRTVVRLFGLGDRFGGTAQAFVFDLSAVTATNVNGTSTGSITAVGNGWFRVVMNMPTTTTTGTLTLRILPQDGANSTYTGNGISGLFLWGAQLVQGSVPGDYQRTDATARAVMYPAPDGSVTGDKLVESVTGATSHLAFQGATITAGLQCTFSVYLKKGERNFARIVLGNAASPFQGVTGAVDLVAGTVVLSTQASPTNASAQIQSVGNDWYRVAVSGIFGAGTTVNSIIYTAATSATINYVGDGTSGIYIWGAQLSDSASLDPYVYNPVAAPTAAAYYGPRFDYDPATLAARGLLIEEQRTNSIRNNTMQGASAPSTFPTNWIGVGAGIGTLTQTIVGVGTSGGIAYIDLRVNGTTSTTSYGLGFDAVTQVAASVGQTWTSSFYIARVGGSVTNLSQIINRIVDRDAGGGNIGSASVDFMPTLSTTLARSSLTRTLAGVGTAAVSNDLIFIFNSGVAIDITLRIGLPQLELGAFATSVIPTTTAAATRTADVATMVGANFSNWYRQDESSMFVEYSGRNGGRAFMTDDGTTNNRFEIRVNNGTSSLSSWSGGVQDITGLFAPAATGLIDGVTVETAFCLKVNDAAISTNGVPVGTDTSCAMPIGLNRMILGSFQGSSTFLNGYIRRIAYYPTRLSNSQLQAISQ